MELPRKAYGLKEPQPGIDCSASLFFTNMSKSQIEELTASKHNNPGYVEGIIECMNVAEKIDLDEMWTESHQRGRGGFELLDADGNNVSIIYKLNEHGCCSARDQFVGIVESRGGERCAVYDNEGLVLEGDGASLGKYPEDHFGYLAFAKGRCSSRMVGCSSDAIAKLRAENPDLELEDDDIFTFSVGYYVDPDTEKVI